MLDFVNQRTGHNVFYKPTLKTMCVMFLGFIAVMALGVIVYTRLKFLWTNWIVWFVGVLLIYITCVSGVVYDIIHDVPFVGRDRQTGEAVIFTDGVIILFSLDSRTIRS
jgi:oligosaccharyltransferase complex subunit gamma